MFSIKVKEEHTKTQLLPVAPGCNTGLQVPKPQLCLLLRVVFGQEPCAAKTGMILKR